MAYPNILYRLYNFLRAKVDGLAFDNAKLDAELNQVLDSFNRLNQTVRGITTTDGLLKNVASATAQALSGAQRFVATDMQTVFQTTITWVASFSNLNVAAYAASIRVDPNTVTVASYASGANTYLQVTLPAQVAGTVVVVDAFESGAGILTKMAEVDTAGAGSDLVSVNDTGGILAATSLTGALQEIVTNLNYFINTTVGPIGEYLKRDGSVALIANLNANGHKLTGLAAASANGEAVRYEQIQPSVLVPSLAATLAATYLPLAGGTLNGDVDFSTFKAINLADGVDPGDSVNKGQLDAAITAATAALVSPTGSLIPFCGDTIPTGWLECDGSEVSQTTYANLYAVVSSKFNRGNEALGNFRLPDLRGRTIIGANSVASPATPGVSDGVTAIAITAGGSGYTSAPTVTLTPPEGGGTTATATAVISGGVVVQIIITARGTTYRNAPTISFSGGGGSAAAATASLSLSSRTVGSRLGEETHYLSIPELPSHTHTSFKNDSSGTGEAGSGSVGPITVNTGATGGDIEHNNIQPSLTVRYLIKT